jgi:hypothetical protein
MAKTWRIIDLSATAGLTYDFLATDVGRVLMENWNVANNGDGTITETMRLKLVDTDANILTSMKKLEAIRAQVDRYWGSQFEYNSVWYECYGAAETAKRSLVREFGFEPTNLNKYTPLLGTNTLIIDMMITRDDFWEAKSSTLIVDATLFNSPVTKYTITAQSGDLPGKMQSLLVGHVNTISNIWAGIKPTRYGIANFVPLWECEHGIGGWDTIALVDATASNGNGLQCDFVVVPTMAQRMTITATQASADFDDLIGKYHVLMRAMCSAAATTFIQLKAGYSGATINPPIGEIQKFDSTNWKFIELGTVDIPSLPYQNPSYSYLAPYDYMFEIWAERTAGAGKLYMDCLVLIPAEHSVIIKGASLPADLSAEIEVTTNDDDEQVVINFDPADGRITNTPESDPHNWWCPIEGGAFVITFEGAAASALTDAIYFQIFNTSRYSHFNY